MATPAMATRSTRPASSPPRDFLKEVTSQGPKLPNRMLVHGVEGIGKTSFASQAPRPIFLMARGETGLESLIDSGRVAETPHFPESRTWADVLGAVQTLITQPHEYRTLVIDALGGIERLCHEHVCAVNFNNDWSDKGFASYGKGPEVSLPVWLELLSLLDRLRAERKMAIIGVAHTKVKTFKNPEGPDYDRYTVDLHEKTWGLTHKWADMVLFANYFTATSKDKGDARAKGVGGQDRVIYTERHAAWDAKNRSGLPAEIEMGNSAETAWGNFMQAVRDARAATIPVPAPASPSAEVDLPAETTTTTSPEEIT
jgi:hypothetical protein